MKHAALGASGSRIWLSCSEAGRHLLTHPKPQTVSSYALEGQKAHDVAEFCFRTGSEPEEYPGVEREMADAVRYFTDHVRGLDLDTVYYERQVRLDTLFQDNPPTPLFGTADVIGIARGTLYVIDYKHGKGVPVDVYENSQLMYYALGALYSLTPQEASDLEAVEIVVVQPRIPGRTAVMEHRIWTHELQTWADDILRPGIVRIMEGPWAFNVGEHCRFCAKLGDCPAQKEQAQRVAKIDFAEHTTTPPTPDSLTDAELSHVLEHSDMIRGFISSVQAEAMTRIELGHDIPGFKVVAKQARRHWIAGQEKHIVKRLGVMAFKDRELKSPTQMEKDLGKDVYKKKVAEYVEQKSSGATIAPKDDRRKAITSTAEHEFSQAVDVESE